MSNFKPGCWVRNEKYTGDYWSKENRTKWVGFPTYRELKKNLKSLIDQTENNELHVSRSRRGEWGEWFEVWVLQHGKPIKIKEGWM